MFFISAIRSFVSANGTRHKKARIYLKPANVRGGISRSPHLIIIKEVDQRNVTKRARKIDAVLEIDFEKITTSPSVGSKIIFP